MTAKILGYAVFGTASGLQAQGSGCLVKAADRVSAYDFDIGRDRRSPLHKGEQALPFIRRLQDNAGNVMTLLGYLSPCHDSHGRSGFFGSCLAIQPYTKSGVLRSDDWSEYLVKAHDIHQETAEKLIENGEFRSYEVFNDSDSEDSPLWDAIPGPMLYVHHDETSQGNIAAPDVVMRLKSLYYTTEGQIADIIILPSDHFEVPSRALGSDYVSSAVNRFQGMLAAEAKKRKQLELQKRQAEQRRQDEDRRLAEERALAAAQRTVEERPPAVRRIIRSQSPAPERRHYEAEEELTVESLSADIIELQHSVYQLQLEMRRLSVNFDDNRSRKGQRTIDLSSSPFAKASSSEGGGYLSKEMLIVLGVAGFIFVLIIVVFAWFFVSAPEEASTNVSISDPGSLDAIQDDAQGDDSIPFE